MKALCLFSILLVAGGFAIAADAPVGPIVVGTNYHTGYIPDGFDTNDHVQLVAEGMFSNSCYKPAPVDVKIDNEKKEIQVNAAAYKYNGLCLQMLVPYHQVLDVGVLQAGTYKVIQGDSEKLGDIKVRVATNSSPDDYLYAPVSQAFVKTQNGKTVITISGEFTNSCMRLAQVLTHVQPKVLVIQPIAEILESADCRDGSFAFEKRVELNGVKRGRYLLHVRSLNAQAMNHLIDVP